MENQVVNLVQKVDDLINGRLYKDNHSDRCTVFRFKGVIVRKDDGREVLSFEYVGGDDTYMKEKDGSYLFSLCTARYFVEV